MVVSTPTASTSSGAGNGMLSSQSSPQGGSKDGGANGYGAGGFANGIGGGSTTPSKPQRPARRIEIEPIISDFRKMLGDRWPRYRDVITGFLTGRLTRKEIEAELGELLDKSMVRTHNQFLLASLANAFRDSPASTSGLLAWNKRSKDAPSKARFAGDPVLARLKSEIMGFTPRERRRLKAITRDAGKKGAVPSTIVLTRQAKVPRLPTLKEKEKQKTNISQDILQSYQAPLAAESFELPDADTLSTRILGIAYEHGLVDGIAKDVPDAVLAGLEYHLRDFLQQIFDRVRPSKRTKFFTNRDALVSYHTLAEPDPDAAAAAGSAAGVIGAALPKPKPARRRLVDDDNIVTAEDMALALELAPHSIVEPGGPFLRLYDVMLQDEMDDLPPP
ncbi:transcriptional regulator of RNA polII, SAGA, subunit-domain-containing protein [Dipodascopsis tothii]|uniref:transcriptional regulator of RNA polII, SAGA, subunit-domain-containing protein n=1 Tax=Dipodascopsis tothii TaxID=44089 RepID=UPI0034CED13A